jgi:signal transduction histidine kinase
VAESNRGLRLLRWVVVGALGCLAGLALWLALLVYRDLIAPLELKLIAAEALAERHGKLASLGVLASGVAHEIRNPLTAIKARVFTLRRRLAEGTAEHNAAEVIDGEINRLERIVQDFLRFARPADPQRIEVAADQLLREVVAFLAPQVAPATLRMDAEGSVSAVVDADPEQIRQVLINLIQNAAEAVSSEGEITLRVRLATRPLGGHQTEVVILEVEDNGCGIPTENANRLFDPFFTTKSAGTGLGLSIAARIVEKHGGALQYQTQVGKGTVFGIVLPCPRKAPRS